MRINLIASWILFMVIFVMTSKGQVHFQQIEAVKQIAKRQVAPTVPLPNPNPQPQPDPLPDPNVQPPNENLDNPPTQQCPPPLSTAPQPLPQPLPQPQPQPQPQPLPSPPQPQPLANPPMLGPGQNTNEINSQVPPNPPTV